MARLNGLTEIEQRLAHGVSMSAARAWMLEHACVMMQGNATCDVSLLHACCTSNFHKGDQELCLKPSEVQAVLKIWMSVIRVRTVKCWPCASAWFHCC
eukprot:840387-Amphidinium_carterae.1